METEFTAAPVRGHGEGKLLGVPTINLSMESVPKNLEEGVYACRASLDGNDFLPCTMHFGPRPAMGREASCEVHILDAEDVSQPESVTVRVVERLRAISDFPSPEALVAQILKDNDRARGILAVP